MLNDHRSRPDITARYEVADPDLHEITRAGLVIDRQLEQAGVPLPVFAMEEKPDGPDFILRQRPLGADSLAGMPGSPPLHRWTVLWVAHDIHRRPYGQLRNRAAGQVLGVLRTVGCHASGLQMRCCITTGGRSFDAASMKSQCPERRGRGWGEAPFRAGELSGCVLARVVLLIGHLLDLRFAHR